MNLPELDGRVAWIFEEDNYDIDLIVGIKNIKITDVKELAAVAMTSYDADFAKTVRAGDLLVGGENFGYGHPHYPSFRAMRHLGIRGVIAESFSPGFSRGETSNGFPLVTCPGIRDAVARWDHLRVDWEAGTVVNVTQGRTLQIEPWSAADRATIEAGGLIPYLKARLARERA